MWRRLVATALALTARRADEALEKEGVCGAHGQDCPRCNASLSKWSHCKLDAEHSFSGGTTAFLKSQDCPIGVAVFVSSARTGQYNSIAMAESLMGAPVDVGDEQARNFASEVLRAANRSLLAMPEETVVRGTEIGVKAASQRSMCLGVFLSNSACSLCIKHEGLAAKVHVEVRRQVNCTVADWMDGQCDCAGAVTRPRLLGLLYSYTHDMLLMSSLNFHMPDPTAANLFLVCKLEGSASFQPPGVQWADFLATSSGQSTRGLLAGSDISEIVQKVTSFFGAIYHGAERADLTSVWKMADFCIGRLSDDGGLEKGLDLCMQKVWSEQQKMSDEELRDFRRFVASEIFFEQFDALSARLTNVERELAYMKNG
ncbi:hypothetical protein AK812_SmicGene45411, partial [Symbiodinium microadriaticum]